MTTTILRIELRRSAAVWAAVISLPLASTWSQVPVGMSGVMGQQRTSLPLLVPLAMGLGSWQARRDRRSRMPELLATTPRPGWQRRLPTATALGLAAVAGSLAVLAGLLVYATVVDAYVPAAVVAASAVVTALGLAAGLWFGLAVGRVAPHVMVPPLLFLGGSVAMGIVSFSADTEGYADGPPPGTLLLAPVSTIGFDAFETLTARAHLAQVSLVAAVAAACLLLGVAQRFRPAALLPLGVGVAVALALLPSSLYDAVTLDRGALALVCTPDEPRVCARRMHPRVLDDLQEPGQQALAMLAAKLPQAPTSVIEIYHGNDLPVAVAPRADTLYADIRTDGSGNLDATGRDVLWTLLAGAGTLPCPDAQQAAGPRYNAARLVAAAWLLDEEPPPPEDPDDPALPGTSVTGPAYDTLLGLPADEQRARVAALREAELACDQRDRLDILVGDSGAP